MRGGSDARNVEELERSKINEVVNMAKISECAWRMRQSCKSRDERPRIYTWVCHDKSGRQPRWGTCPFNGRTDSKRCRYFKEVKLGIPAEEDPDIMEQILESANRKEPARDFEDIAKELDI